MLHQLVSHEISSAAMELLYIREAWGLTVAVEIPRCEPAPSPGTSSRPALPDLEARWTSLWLHALSWERSLQSPEQLAPIFWSVINGPTGVDRGALGLWQIQVTQTLTDHIMLEYGRRPRNRAHRKNMVRMRPALRVAESRGLRTIVVLPLADPYTAWLSHSRLAVAMKTYVDVDALTTALAAQPDR